MRTGISVVAIGVRRAGRCRHARRETCSVVVTRGTRLLATFRSFALLVAVASEVQDVGLATTTRVLIEGLAVRIDLTLRFWLRREITTRTVAVTRRAWIATSRCVLTELLAVAGVVLHFVLTVFARILRQVCAVSILVARIANFDTDIGACPAFAGVRCALVAIVAIACGAALLTIRNRSVLTPELTTPTVVLCTGVTIVALAVACAIRLRLRAGAVGVTFVTLRHSVVVRLARTIGSAPIRNNCVDTEVDVALVTDHVGAVVICRALGLGRRLGRVFRTRSVVATAIEALFDIDVTQVTHARRHALVGEHCIQTKISIAVELSELGAIRIRCAHCASGHLTDGTRTVSAAELVRARIVVRAVTVYGTPNTVVDRLRLVERRPSRTTPPRTLLSISASGVVCVLLALLTPTSDVARERGFDAVRQIAVTFCIRAATHRNVRVRTCVIDTIVVRTHHPIVAFAVGLATIVALVGVEVTLGVDSNRAHQLHRVTKHTGKLNTFVSLRHADFGRTVGHKRVQRARRLQVRNDRPDFTFWNIDRRLSCRLVSELLLSWHLLTRGEHERNQETHDCTNEIHTSS